MQSMYVPLPTWPALFPSLLLTIALVLLPYVSSATSSFSCSSDSSLDVCLKDDYSKFQLPYETNIIGVSIYLDEVLKVDDKDYTITMATFLNIDWVEPRLTLGGAFKNQHKSSRSKYRTTTTRSKYRTTTTKYKYRTTTTRSKYRTTTSGYKKYRIITTRSKLGTTTTRSKYRKSRTTTTRSTPRSKSLNLPINSNIISDLWLPNLYIYNLKDFQVKEALVPLKGVWVDSEKNVLLSQNAHISFFCAMDFTKFPFDTQNCKFQVGSYSWNDKKMLFYTKNFGYMSKMGNNIALDYFLGIKSLDVEDKTFDGGEELGGFSLAGFELILTRQSSTYVITYMLPQGLLVMVSWISFLVPCDSTSSRGILLGLVLLVQVNIFNSVATNTPRTQGLTAIDAWMFFCILFVFAALIQFSAIVIKKKQKNKATEDYTIIDKYSLICFAATFLLFNVIYWFSVLL